MNSVIYSGEFTDDFIDCAKFVNNFFSEKGKDVINFISFATIPTPVHTSFRIGNQSPKTSFSLSLINSDPPMASLISLDMALDLLISASRVLFALSAS